MIGFVFLRVLLLAAALLTAVSGYTWAQADRLAGALPPIDIFIYADESKTVRSEAGGSTAGRTPAIKITEMIAEVANQPLLAGSGRRVLDGDGRLYLYGFGGLLGSLPPSGSRECDSTTRNLFDPGGGGGFTRAEFDAAGSDRLAFYAAPIDSGDRDYQSTDFTCLFRDIAANAAIRQSQAEGRQAVVLIASDFLHDPFNQSVIGSGSFAGLGICGLNNNYVAGNLPRELNGAVGQAEAIPRAANVDEQQFPTRFGLLVLNLTDEDITSKSPRYRACQLAATERQGEGSLLSKILQERLRASIFNFTDGTAQEFATGFVERLIASAEDPLLIDRADLTPTAGGGAALTLALRNRAAFTSAEITKVTLAADGDPVTATDIRDVFVDKAAGPTQPTIAPLRLTGIPGLRPGQPYRVEVEYTARPGDVPRISASRTAGWGALDVTLLPDRSQLILPGQERLSVAIQNNTNRRVTIADVAFVLSGGSIPTSWDGSQEVGAGNAQTIQVQLQPLAGREPLPSNATLRVEIEEHPGTGRVAIETPLSIEPPAPPQLLAAEIRYPELDVDANTDGEPLLSVTIANPNPFPFQVIALRFGPPDGVDTEITLNRPLTIDGGGRILQAWTRDAFAGGLTPLLNAIVSGPTNITVVSDLPVNGVSASRKLTETYPNNVLVCPSEDRPDTFRWVNGTGDTLGQVHLELVFETSHPTYRLRPIKWIAIAGGDYEGEVIRARTTGEAALDNRRRKITHLVQWPEALHEVKHTRTIIDTFTLRLLDENKGDICETAVSIKAHNENGHPKPFDVIDINALDDRPGLLVTFEHQSEGSFNRLDYVHVIPPGRPQDATVIWEGKLSPVEPKKVSKVEIDLPDGMTNQELSNMELVLGSNVHGPGPSSEIPDKVLGPSRITDYEWAPDAPLLKATVTATRFVVIDRIAFSATPDPRTTDHVVEVPVRPVVPITLDGALSKTAAIDALMIDAFRSREDLETLTAESLYACPLAEGQSYVKCGRIWRLLDPLPAAAGAKLEPPVLSGNGQSAKVTVSNIGSVYPAIMRKATATFPNGETEVIDVDPPIIVPPGRVLTENITRLSSVSQKAVRLGGLALSSGSIPASASGAVDPPSVALVSAEIDEVSSFLEAVIYEFPEQAERFLFGGRAVGRSPNTVVTGEVRVFRERPPKTPSDGVEPFDVVVELLRSQGESLQRVRIPIQSKKSEITPISHKDYSYAFLIPGDVDPTHTAVRAHVVPKIDVSDRVFESDILASYFTTFDYIMDWIIVSSLAVTIVLFVIFGLYRKNGWWLLIFARGALKYPFRITLGIIVVGIFTLILSTSNYPTFFVFAAKSLEILQAFGITFIGLIGWLSLKMSVSRYKGNLMDNENKDWILLASRYWVIFITTTVFFVAIGILFVVFDHQSVTTVVDICRPGSFHVPDRTCP